MLKVSGLVGRRGRKANLDAIDRVDILHAVEHNPANLFHGLVRPHDTHCATLHEHIALCEELNSLYNY
jgi:hypothetical protein